LGTLFKGVWGEDCPDRLRALASRLESPVGENPATGAGDSWSFE